MLRIYVAVSLSLGSRLGSYQIVAAIGAGGMGEVYRARDTKLDRDVAIKVLPEVFARDASRMARFGREAKVLAALDHPNIAAIYGLEDSGDTRALVMQLAEGPTLAERIARGPIPIEESLSMLGIQDRIRSPVGCEHRLDLKQQCLVCAACTSRKRKPLRDGPLFRRFEDGPNLCEAFRSE